MNLQVLLGLFAGICVIVIIAAPPPARGYVPGNVILTPETVETTESAGVREPSSSLLLVRPPVGRDPQYVPVSEEASAPIPEPGTLTLAALGLVAIGAATRKRFRRPADAPATAPLIPVVA